MYRAPTVPKKELPPINESDEDTDEVFENFSQAHKDLQSNPIVHSDHQMNDVGIDASQATSQAVNTQISVSYEQSNAVVMIQTSDEVVEAPPVEDLDDGIVVISQTPEVSHDSAELQNLDQQKRPLAAMSQLMFNQNFASQGNTNVVEMAQNGDAGSKSKWDALINSTYYILMAHAKNKLSVIPDPGYSSKLDKWHTLVKQNKANVGSLMQFVVNSAHEFEKSADANRSVTRGLELAEATFTRGKSSSTTPKKTKSTPPTTEKKKRKKNERYCRACKSYFVFSRPDQNICDDRKCQARRCTHCDGDRVKSRGGKCKACYEGK